MKQTRKWNPVGLVLTIIPKPPLFGTGPRSRPDATTYQQRGNRT